MTAIKNMNKAQFNQMLKKFDTNNDGKLDQTDVENLASKGAVVSGVKDFFGFITGGLSYGLTGTGSDASRKAEQLKGMLARDNNGRIDEGDIKQPSSRNAYSSSSKTSSKTNANSTSDLQKKIESNQSSQSQRPERHQKGLEK